MKLFTESVLIVLVSAVLALATWAIHPKTPKWNPNPIDPNAVSIENIAPGDPLLLWLDARPDSEFEAGHIPNAIQLNLENWDAHLETFLLEHWEPEQTVIVYCGGQGCNASKEVMEKLRIDVPEINVKYLKGGWPAWNKKYPAKPE